MILWTTSDFPPSPFHLLRNLDFKVWKDLYKIANIFVSGIFKKIDFMRKDKSTLSEHLILENLQEYFAVL